MRLIASPLTLLLHGLAVLAVAGIVHVVTILEAPDRATHDAFARLAAVTPLNAMARLQPGMGGAHAIPFRDPAMVGSACRFDLSNGPLGLVLDPLDRGFVAIGMYSRRGTVFYGLNVRSSERSPITMELMTAAQKAAREAAESDDEPARDLRIVAPEPQGFVLVDTPAQEGRGAPRAETLDRIRCGTLGLPALRP